MTQVDVGDILCVRTTGPFSWLIRFAAKLRRLPSTIDHVAIVTRIDPDGTPWTVEAWAPNGVREHYAADYVASSWTIANVGQPKDAVQRAKVAAVASLFLEHGYDFAAILADAANVFNIKDPWLKQWSESNPPNRVVCSSLAAWVYQQAGLACPNAGREVTPAEWAQLIDANHWG